MRVEFFFTQYYLCIKFTIIVSIEKEDNEDKKDSDCNGLELKTEQITLEKTPLLKDITYTISPFIHAPFLQHNMLSNSNINEPLLHRKITYIGDDKLTVTFCTKGKNLPYGVYPRRLVNFFTKYVTRKKLKSADFEIVIPNNKFAFLKEVLAINYTPNSEDMKSINQQLQAFAECLVSINHTNPNDKSRKNRTDFSFFNDDISFLWDDKKEWKYKVTLSDDFFELIKNNAVPVSDLAAKTYRSALKVDVLNYLIYQNYNLQRKSLNFRFQFVELHNLFGSGTTLAYFKKTLKLMFEEFKTTANLQIADINKDSFLLISSEDAKLYKKERRKTNADPNAPIAISQEQLNKYKKEFGELEVLSALDYMMFRQQEGTTYDRPSGYLKDVLNNKSWYAKFRVANADNIRKQQYAQWSNLDKSLQDYAKDELIKLVSSKYIYDVPEALRTYLHALKTPGVLAAKDFGISFDYTVFLFWTFINRKFMKSNNVHEQSFLQLFNCLFGSSKMLDTYL